MSVCDNCPEKLEETDNFIDTIDFREELFYQLGLRQFGNMSRIKLSPPPSLRTLVTIAIDVEKGIDERRMNKQQIIDVRVIVSYAVSVAERCNSA